ncbi:MULTISPECIES: DUF916 and DUF3324 domain-containing protein [unclassified Enterococcus]|uniref:DUF916 and DUF3324 domain-containing protein n=1 Tax=unclassified Enterococcus TaxID=2608891 RepID=UPI00155634B1|nr:MULTISPECIES: DUF916 and DUF3324 domain-containing protein [unclassified Enterococcus]MBS7577358.1 DUF916 and DUF3324 domain-containing protein [Enterococcus sp. MMGLQ5-2]MBS7584765.1 DUF916 and DUF3324 domain-containing protein [Enterococcus sp. MMGLQ5-1]NPD12620.1 DUF916 and DUF3324 domain-containing protein [Enterococcus sp. MMGLQ5-1]NPD37192.1 DUF916 and DUF3324 domain-containing protein [Enterococcus sp. MMGLQ5-2]
MKYRKPILLSLVLFFSLLIGLTKVKASEFNYSVTPVIPDNQIDKSKTYYDLLMSPGQSQTVEVQLRNDTENDLVIENSINSATTNLNGVVEYSDNNIKTDSSLKYNLKDLATVESEVTIPKKSSIILPIKLMMPNEKFDGIIAGGITFKEKPSDETTTASSDGRGVAIKNEYSYAVAVLLRQNEKQLAPELKLLDASAGQVNSRNVINAKFQNSKAAYLNQLKLENKITKKGSRKVLFSSEAEQLQMAPNSNFSYPISLNGEKLEAGVYTLNTVAYSGKSDTGQYEVKNSEGDIEKYQYKWEFTKDFKIEASEAKELNSNDVSIERDFTWLYLLIIILIALVIVIIFLFFRNKKKKSKAEINE